MPGSTVETPSPRDDLRAAPWEAAEQTNLLETSLRGSAFAGFAATLLMILIELVDLNLTDSGFYSFSDRVLLLSYSGLSLLSGLVLGLAAGVAAWLYLEAVRLSYNLFQRAGTPRVARAASHAVVILLATVALNQSSHVHRYAIGLLREVEKLTTRRDLLIANETALSYLVVGGLVAGLLILRLVTVQLRTRGGAMRAAFALILFAGISAAYVVDSRVEVLLYEHTLHRSMFLVNLALAMSLVATVWSPGGRRFRWTPVVAVGVLVLLSAGFAFIKFDSNQQVKNVIFQRTSQARQHIGLVKWALDFDRDGWSPFLGGGDLDDRRADVNPGETERPDNGLDDNCIGGDVTLSEIDAWAEQFQSRRAGPASPNGLNVVFVFIDTLRPDHLGVYGYGRNTSPDIDRLAARSTVFENAMAPSPDTFGTIPRLMQAAYWDGHFETWSEVLARNGYDALFFPRREGFMMRHLAGMTVVEEARVETFPESIDVAIRTLSQRADESPFFAFLYSFDPHLTYKRHAGFDFGPGMIDRYDSEIAYTDFHLGRFIEWLERAGRMDDTMIVIMSDHGESLGEHGVYRHATQLYNEQIAVPMIVYVPGLSAGRVADYVSVIDLGPTILDAAGIDYPGEHHGVSLLPWMKGEAATHPPVYAEQVTTEASPFVPFGMNVHPDRKKYMVVDQIGFKLIYNRNFYGFELFDLKSDPAESRNLYERRPEKVVELKRLLGRFVDVMGIRRPWDADDSKHSKGRDHKLGKFGSD